MKLYTFYNKRFEKLKERFLATIKDDYEIKCVYLDFDSPGKRDIRTLIIKSQFIHNAIKENMGHVIIFSDIDIQFFLPTRGIVEKYIKNNDMVFQCEYAPIIQGVNTGFMALRCNENVLNFWKSVVKIMRETRMPPKDQTIVRFLLGFYPNYPGLLPDAILERSIKWTVFPRSVWVCTSYKAIPPHIILHHAAYSRYQDEKLAQMEEVKKMIEIKHSLVVDYFIHLRRSFFYFLFILKRIPLLVNRLTNLKNLKLGVVSSYFKTW